MLATHTIRRQGQGSRCPLVVVVQPSEHWPGDDTFASHPVMRGVPLKVVQELMSHEDIKTTMRYAHLMPQMRQEAVALLDAAAPHGATQGPHSLNWP